MICMMHTKDGLMQEIKYQVLRDKKILKAVMTYKECVYNCKRIG